MNSENPLLIGIDWADQKHDYHIIYPDGSFENGSFEHAPEAIEQAVQAWIKQAKGAAIAVGIEANKGALVNALLEYPPITIYPINPSALSHYRKSYAHGGGKNDPVDAKRIAGYLRDRLDQLAPLSQDSPLTRELATIAQDRRIAVDQRADLSNQLTALLKQYYPAIRELKPAKPYAEFFLKFLLAYPTLRDAQSAKKARLLKFFHGVNMKGKAERHAQTLLDAKPLTNDEVTVRCLARRAVMLAEQLLVLNKHIKRYETLLKKLLPEHPDYYFVESLPGSSTNTQARMIAALGDDRGRYATAESLQAATGIAPITTQSGRSKLVHRRWACSKFHRQTFHEYARLSINMSRWAQAFYDQQVAKGKSAPTALRALAYKWQRIIHACWRSGEPYDEARYIERLRATGSPLVKLLSTTS